MTNKDIVTRNRKGLLHGYCERHDAENTLLFEETLLFRLNYHNGRHSGYCEWHKHFNFAQYFIR